MTDERDRRIDQVKTDLARKEQLQTQLADTSEALDREAFRRDLLEAELAVAAESVRQIEGASLTGLIYALLGTRADRLAARRQRWETIEQEYDECRENTSALEKKLADLEQQFSRLPDLSDLDAEYQSLYLEKERALSDGNDERTRNLNELDAELAALAASSRLVERALESGEDLLTHIEGSHSACRQMGRRRGRFRTGGGVLVDVLVSTAVKSWNEKQADGLVSGLQSALQRFRERLSDLDLSSDIKIDAEIVALLPEIDGLCADPSVGMHASTESWAIFEIPIRTMIDNLRERLIQTQKGVDALQHQRQGLIEQA